MLMSYVWLESHHLVAFTATEDEPDGDTWDCCELNHLETMKMDLDCSCLWIARFLPNIILERFSLEAVVYVEY